MLCARRLRRATAVCAGVVGLCCTLVLAADAPVAKVMRATSPIQIDGLLTETAWDAVEWSSGFVMAGAVGDDEPLKTAEVQTRFKVTFDDAAAYVAVECDEPAIDKVKAQTPWRDGAVWQDDCVEIFFDPSNEGRYYHQVMVNPRSTIYDCHCADYGLVHSRLWNGAFRAAAQIDVAARKWRVEIEIPFGAIVLGEGAGGTWKWNVTRERQAGGTTELTSWAPLRRNFHQPRLFGSLVGLPTDYSAFRLDVQEPRVDVSRSGGGLTTLNLALTVRNDTGRERKVAAAVALFEDESVAVKAEPVTLAAGAEGVLQFTPLGLRGSAPSTSVVFSLRDADTGMLLKAVVKSLASEYRPVSLTVLRPCYRNSIYPTEELREILFRVDLSAEVKQAASVVSYALVDGAGKCLGEGRATGAAIGRPLALPLPDLAPGSYTLRVEAVKADGTAQAGTETTIHKLAPPPAGHEVRIDENRNLLVDGKPLFAIGWYGSVPVEDPRPDVVALQNVQTPVVVDLPDVSGIAKAYREHGIYSIVSVELGRLFYTFKLWQSGKEELRKTTEEYHTLTEPSAEVRRMARELVEAVRGEPGLVGYYIADEPEIHDTRSSYLEAYYRYLCELDPYHPVFVTNDTIDGLVTHGYKCADVLNPDPYSPEWDYVPSFLRKVNEVAELGKTTYVTLWHSTSQTHFVREYGTAPPYPYKVFRNQYFVSIALGAKGFTAYTSPFFMNEIEYRYGLPYVWRELRFLEKAILAPEPTEALQVEARPGVTSWAREVGGRVYLVLANHKPGAAYARVSWAPLKTRRSLTVLSEGREVKVTGGVFEDRFGEGDVHVYTDAPEAKGFPTTQEVTAELAQREKEAVKPGNLLHWTHGTTARCSAGYYAPWFSQFFYYAINGLTDDTGWYSYASGNKPAWLELTLKQQAQIGRVVLYTPNLRDYTIDFVAPGQPTRRVTVAGNEQTVVVHNLKPAVPCLKLRVTVTAIRETQGAESRGPKVAEIEAYAESAEGPITPVETIQAEAAARPPVLFGDETEPQALWSDDFTNFQTAPQYYWDARDTKWVLNSETFRARPKAGGGIIVASASPKGYDAMTHIFPYDAAYRFFQAKLSNIEGQGYRFAHVSLSDSSGAPGYRGAINTSRPGIYTVDTHYIHESYRVGRAQKCFLRLNTAGAQKRDDGTVTPGPEFTFDWLRLVRRPLDGLVVTLADGAPLPETVGEGDRLHFELHLSALAQDAVVEVQVGPNYEPLAINGEPYVQLQRGDEKGKVWVGEVTLGTETGKFTPKGYPVVFRAVITGGMMTETFASAFVEFK